MAPPAVATMSMSGAFEARSERRRRAAPGAPERRARQRQREEAVCQVIQSR